jgi:hypothetical protein
MNESVGLKSAALLMLLINVVPFAYGQKTRFGPRSPEAKTGVDYPVRVHVTAIQIRSHCSELKGPASCRDVVYAESVIDGKKLELMGDRVWLPTFYVFPVTPGDYKARITKEAPTAVLAPLDREYELVMPDETVWPCSVTGISE